MERPRTRKLRFAILGFIAILAAGLLFAAVRGPSAEGNDVDSARNVRPLLSAVPLTSVGASITEGNVTTIEYSGNFDRGNFQARQEVTTRFYQDHGDQFDFLVFFTTFDIATEDALGFYSSVRNDVRGIGTELFDNSGAFASHGRLQGLIDMARVTDDSLDPIGADFPVKLRILSHEVMHRWTAHVAYLRNGQPSYDLIGRDNSHWSYFLDSDASVMYGSDWRADGGGQFTSVGVAKGYSPLDLYLAGFNEAQEVPDMTLIRSASGSADDVPVMGATLNGTPETVSIGQITAQEGARQPDAQSSQKHFRATFVLVKRPGEQVSPGVYQGLEQLRREFSHRFVAMTGGRAQIEIRPSDVTVAAPGSPTPLSGSVHGNGAADLARARAWLAAHQRPNGSWQDKSETPARDTAAVVGTLREVGDSQADLSAAVAWLTSLTTDSLDEAAQRAIGIADTTTFSAALSAARNEDGGFGVGAHHASSPFDTALMLDALDSGDSTQGLLAGAISYLKSQQNADGSFGVVGGGYGRIATTARALNVLSRRDPACAQVCATAAAWLAAQQLPTGGFGDGASDTAETLLVLGRIAPNSPVLAPAIIHLSAQQGVEGDWGGSAHTTARALLALERTSRPNLYVTGQLTTTPSSPRDGDRVLLTGMVGNSGNQPSAISAARWYDGPPTQGGMPIATDVPIPSLPPGASFPIATLWNTRGHEGAHDLWLVVDVANTVAEINEADNTAHRAVVVTPPSQAPDLAVFAEEVIVSPDTVTQLPTTVHVTIPVHNLGMTATSSVDVALAEVIGSAVNVSSTRTLMVPARSSTLATFDYTVSVPGSVRLAAIADPDRQIAEASEDNNRAEFNVNGQPGIDLDISQADLQQVTTSPVSGRDMQFRIGFRNRGTSDTPLTRIVTRVDRGNDPVVIDDQQIQLGGGASSSRLITWRPPASGNYALHVMLDPDNLVTETDKTNNVASSTFVVGALQGPNLSLTPADIILAPVPPRQGADMHVGVTVHNDGVDATGAFELAAYDGDPRTNGTLLAQTSVPPLPASSQVVVDLVAPDFPRSGDRVVYVAADLSNAVSEQDKSDNIAFVSMHVLSLPDLSVLAADVSVSPTTPVPGQVVDVSAIVRNLGEQAVGSVRAKLLLGSAEVAPAQTISIGALGQSPAHWSWTLGANSVGGQLTLVVDDEAQVRESNENNNRVSVPLALNDDDVFATEPYISPNGDGVKDSTAIVVRVAPGEYSRIDVVNNAQEMVRTFQATQLAAGHGQILWDGRDSVGRVVRDGDYRLILRREDGNFVGQVTVTVDNNRSALAEVIGSPLARDQWLPLSDTNSKHFPYTTTSGQPGVLVVDPDVDPYDSANHQHLTGLYRNTAGDLMPVVTGRWFSRQAAALGASTKVWDIKASAYSSLAALELRDSHGAEPRLAIVDVSSVDSVRIVSAAFAYGFEAEFVGPTLLYVAYSNGSVQVHAVIDATDGSMRTLHVESAGAKVIGHSDRGLYVFDSGAGKTVRFVPFAADVPSAQWALVDQIPGDVQFRGVGPHRDTIWYGFDDAAGSHMYARDGLTGALLLQYSYPVSGGAIPTDGASPGFEHGPIGLDPSPDGLQLVVTDAAAAKLVTVTLNSGEVREYPLPIETSQYQASIGNGGWSASYALSDARRSFDAIRVPAHPVTRNLVWSWDSSHVLVAFGDVLTGTKTDAVPCGECPLTLTERGITRVVDVNLRTGETNELARYTDWPSESLAPTSSEWSIDKLVLEKNSRFSLLEIDRGRPFPDGGVTPGDAGFYRARNWPSDTGASQYDFQSGITHSLANLSVHLEAKSLGTSFILSGFATDRNFATYELEWAPESTPEQWQAITDPLADPIIDDEFMWWAPPAAGPLLVRLTATDKAGNKASDMIRVVAVAASPIGRLSVSPRYISPNGDDVQDAATISFAVLRPATLDVRVINSSGAVVYETHHQYGGADLGLHSEVWDGRNQSGQIAPDGTYYVNVGASRFTVVVDSTLPAATNTVFEPYQKNGLGHVSVSPGLKTSVLEAHVESIDVEYGVGDQPSHWYLLSHGTGMPRQDQPGMSDEATPLTPVLYRDYSFRAAIRDRAGNSARVAFAKPVIVDGRLILRYLPIADPPPPPNPGWPTGVPFQDRPFSSNVPGTPAIQKFASGEPMQVRVTSVVAGGISDIWPEVRRADGQSWQQLDGNQYETEQDTLGIEYLLNVKRGAVLPDGVAESQIRVVALSAQGETVISNATRIKPIPPDEDDGSGGGGIEDGDGLPSRTRIVALGEAQCGAGPTNQVLYEAAIPSSWPVKRLTATYRNPLTGQTETLLDVDHPLPNPSCGFPVYKVMDLAGLPEGQISISTKFEFIDGAAAVEVVKATVDHSPPRPAIDVPPDGSKVCVFGDRNEPTTLPVLGRVEEQYRAGYLLEFSSASRPDSASPINKGGFDEEVKSCFDNAEHVEGFTLQGFDGELGDLAQPSQPGFDLRKFNGAGIIRLKSTDWSGAMMCAENSIYVDSSIDAKLIDSSPLLDWHEGPKRAGISSAPTSTQRAAHVHVSAHEDVTADLEIHPVVVEANGDWSAGDAVLDTPLHNQQVGALTDLVWNGTLHGSDAADGDYALVVVAQDECGHEQRFVTFATVDSTPPALAIASPTAGQIIETPLLEVTGNVADAHFKQYVLEVSGADGVWQPLNTGNEAVPTLAVLGRWAPGTASGAFQLRLRANDRLGNSSEVVAAVTRPETVALITAITFAPDLISPNGDGQFDQANLIVSLGRNAGLTTSVLDAGGAMIAVLADGGTRGPGAQPLPWAGRNGGGAVVPDGNYQIVVRAVDPSAPSVSAQSTLSVAVDNTPPGLTQLAPVGEFSNGSGAVRFQVQDAHLRTLHARLSGGDTPMVVEFDDTHAGVFDLANLTGLPEGVYNIAIDAQDRAANASHFAAQFEIDRTKPTIALTAPADGKVLARNTPIDIVGTASDRHFDHYEVALASAQAPSTWTPVRSSTSAVTNGVLAQWTANVSDGDYSLRVSANDKAGNEDQSIVAIAVDGTPPVVQIVSPEEGARVSGDVVVSGTATDAHLGEYRISIATPQQATQDFWSDLSQSTSAVDHGTLGHVQLALADGDYVLRVSAKDAAGLTTSKQVRIHLDRAPPTTPTGLAATVVQNRDSSLHWNAVSAEDLAGYYVYRGAVRLNAQPVTSPAYQDVNAPEGVLTYRVSSVDAAGNESARSDPASIMLDHTAPLHSISNPAPGARVRGVVAIDGVAYSADDFREYRLSMQPMSPPGPATMLGSSTAPVVFGRVGLWDTTGLAEETHVRLSLDAEDTNGNIGTSAVEVVVDNQPPAAPNNVQAVLDGDDVVLTWNPNTEIDLLGYVAYRGGQIVGWQGQVPVDLRAAAITEATARDAHAPDGTLEYTVIAVDQAGNVSAPSAPATLTLDRRAPELSIVNPRAGYRFDTTLHIVAISPDQDVVAVQFSYRPVSGSDWVDIGPPLSNSPFEAFWTPGNLPHGDYLVRGTATDTGGLTTPNPPTVQVHYADLTTPDAPTALVALVDGDTAMLGWLAPTASDVVGYRISRRDSGGIETVINGAPVTSTHYEDTGLADGSYTYRVAAVDAEGNQSPWSEPTVARVFTPQLAQPYTPTLQAPIALDGTSPVAGQVAVTVSNGGVDTHPPGAATPADGTIHLEGIALARGDNSIFVRVTDAAGNVSRPAHVLVGFDSAPQSPAGVQANVTDHHVSVHWSPNNESNLLGYRVFRRGQPVWPDAAYEQPLSVSPPDAYVAADGDTATAWTVYRSASGLAPYGSVQLSLDEPAVVSALHLTWGSVATRAVSYRIDAWSGDAWVPVASVAGNAVADNVLSLVHPYRTAMLRIVALTAVDAVAPVAWAEVGVILRPVRNVTSFDEELIDGSYAYTVTALNSYAFESAPSQAAPAEIGDTTPPGAVILTATGSGRDVLLSWTASNALDLAQYRIYRDGAEIARVAGTQLGYTDAGRPNGHYAYHVDAVDGFENQSAHSNIATADIDGAVPGAPKQLSVTAPEQGAALDLVWDAGDGPLPDHYVVKRSLSAQGPFSPIGQVSAKSYRDQPLANGTTYYYTVAAFDVAGNSSADSNIANGTPRDIQAPFAPMLFFPTDAGHPLALDAARTDVLGLAEPGALVDLYANGARVDRQTALPGAAARRLDGGSASAQLSVSSNGRWLWDGGRVFDLIGSNASPFDYSVDAIGWSPDGRWAYGIQGGLVNAYDLVSGRASSLSLDISLVRFALPAPDGAHMLVGGTRDAGGGSTVSALWYIDLSSGTVSRRFDADLSGIDAASVSFSPDGRRIALRTAAGALLMFDFAHDAPQTVLSGVEPGAPAWSADSSRVHVAQRQSDLSVKVVGYNIASGASVVLNSLTQNQTHPQVSPDGSTVAYIADGSAVELRALNDGHLVALYPRPGVQAFAWATPGRLAVMDSLGYALIDQPGLVVFHGVALVPGENEFHAQAIDGNQNPGLPSASIVVRRPGGLPNLSIRDSDIRFVPAGGAAGERYSASVTVRNTGAARSLATSLRAQLSAPAGSTTILAGTPVVDAIDPGEERALAIDLGVLPSAGRYRVIVDLDPANTLAESNENDNSAAQYLQLTVDGAPDLALAVAQSSFAAGEDVSATATVTGAGGVFSGRVRTRIEDAQGVLVADLGSATVSSLGNAQQRMLPLTWVPGDVLAGHYRLHAVLTDAHDGVVADRIAPFDIASTTQISLSVTGERSAYATGATARILVNVQYGSGNALLGNARLTLRALGPSGTQVFLWQRDLGALLPGFRTQLTAPWNLQGIDPSLYSLELSLESDTASAQTSGSVQVLPLAPTTALAGAIALASPPLTLGMPASAHYTVSNVGSLAVTTLPARARLIAVTGQQELAIRSFQVSLTPGSSAAGDVDLTSSAMTTGSHLLVLEVQMPGAPGDGWVRIAQTGADAVDRLPPAVSISDPREDAAVRTPLPVKVAATDAHSGVERVDVSADGGSYRIAPLSAQGGYALAIDDLADGTHTLVARSRDRAGNIGFSAIRHFLIDNTPPTLDITGVTDGEFRNAPVTPVLNAIDAGGIDSTTLLLNGQSYVSGTTIAAQGNHVLSASARDRAGNVASVEVHFTIDLVAPTLLITNPADSSVVELPAVDVIVQTEASAKVELERGLYIANGVAAADGSGTFAAVPLDPGANVIRVRARDAAGNIGLWVAVNVTRHTSVVLSGSLSAAGADLPAGEPVAFNYVVHNGGLQNLVAQPLRLRITHDTTQTELRSDPFVADIAIGANTGGQRQYSSVGWPLGAYTAVFETDVGQPSWLELGRATFTLADHQAPTLEVLAPVGNSYVAGDVVIRAHATDALSGIDKVEARVDGNPWFELTLTDSSGGIYASNAQHMADGAHVVEIRATDLGSNSIEVAPVNFTVDSASPVISISGVVDGQVSNHPLTPVVISKDASPVTLTLTLDGAAFVSGTPVAGEGSHTLHATARDAAGNEVERSVQFTIDTTAPTVQIVSPVDGATVATATVDVIGRAEPDASVELESGAFSVNLQADAQGDFRVNQVPLAVGANLIRVRARDQAQNIGNWNAISVTRQSLAVGCHMMSDRLFRTGFEWIDRIFCDDFEAQAGASLTLKTDSIDSLEWLAMGGHEALASADQGGMQP